MISYGQIFEAGTQYKIFYKEILQSYLKPQESFFFLSFLFLLQGTGWNLYVMFFKL